MRTFRQHLCTFFAHEQAECPARHRRWSWKTGDERMTAAQRSYLETLARETGEEVNHSLSTAEASTRIDELCQRSPRVAEGDMPTD